MSLAPTLLTSRPIAPTTGGVTLLGLAIATNVSVPAPAQAALSLAGLTPTMSIVVGPVISPDVGDYEFIARDFTLQRILIISPALPEATPEDTDLAPTILLGNSSSAGTPGVGALSLTGLAPTVVGDGAYIVEMTASTALVLSGLAPTLGFEAINEGTKSPGVGSVEFIVSGLEPTLVTEKIIETAALGVRTALVVGLAPTIVSVAGWQRVTSAPARTWTDIPRAT
jgi:hypothetical protein